MAKADSKKSPDSTVEGRIYFEYGLPAGMITVRLYSRSLGGVETLLGESKTDMQGLYKVAYHSGRGSTNLEVRAVYQSGKEVTLSGVKFGPEKTEVMNLVAHA